MDGTTIDIKKEKTEEKINTVVDAYEHNFHMLNYCIDCIEHFEKRLEKSIKKSNSKEEIPPPSIEEAIDIVRKVKYAFNTNEAIRPYTPDETVKKIFIRLFNTVHWMDEICRTGCVPQYNERLVKDVVEPLFTEETLKAINDRLSTKKKKIWSNLGPSWNISSERWTEQVKTYVPTFDSHHTFAYSENSTILVQPQASGSTIHFQEEIKTSHAAPSTKSHSDTKFESPEMSSSDLGRLFTVAVRHVSANIRELDAAPGDSLNLLEKTNNIWWLLRDRKGVEGLVPKWKLKPYNPNARLRPSSLNDLTDENVVPKAVPVTRVPSLSSQPPVVKRVVIAISPEPRCSPVSVTRPPADVEVISRPTKVPHQPVVPPTPSPHPPDVQLTTSIEDIQHTTSLTNTSNPGSLVYLTPDQLNDYIRNTGGTTQVPMVLVPVADLYKYTGPPNLATGLNGQQAPMKWPDLDGYGEGRGTRSPTLTSPATLDRWKPVPLAAPSNATHMHTMTRELRERLSTMRTGGGTGLKAVPSPTTTADKVYGRLSKYASKEEVAEWLIARNFPPTAIQALRGFNGMDLYTMNRSQLEMHVGDRNDEIYYAFRGS